MKLTKTNILKWAKDHKIHLIIGGIAGGYAALWYILGRKVGFHKGMMKGINIGADADVRFIKHNVPEAAKMIMEFARNNPDLFCLTDEEFAKEVLKHNA